MQVATNAVALWLLTELEVWAHRDVGVVGVSSLTWGARGPRAAEGSWVSALA